VGERMSGRAKAVFATVAVLVIVIASASVMLYMQQMNADQQANLKVESEIGYWELHILPVQPGLGTVTPNGTFWPSPMKVEPNGTIYVPRNQTGITVTAVPEGINGFMHWIFDGEIVANQSSTIFISKQYVNTFHTLEAVFVRGTPVISPFPTSSASPSSLGGKQEADVLAIGKKYVAENYGTDYFVNSVGPVNYSETGPNGTVTYDYPTASFRVPADMQKSGELVYVMVNPQTGEIVKTWTSWSKSLPPTTPP
jgi:hypothetical protein